MGPAFNWIPIAGSNPVQRTFIEHRPIRGERTSKLESNKLWRTRLI